MPFCFPNCFPTLPRSVSERCSTERRVGGIQRLVFALCTLDTANVDQWSSLDWCNYYRTGQIVITPKLLANKPESSYQKRKLSSCSAETVIGITHKIEFEDNSFDAESHLDNSFWQNIAKNPQNYPFGYIDCGGYFTGFMNPVGMEVSHVIPDTNNESAYWKGAIEFNSLELQAPSYIAPSLEAVLRGCVGVPNFNKCLITGSLGYLGGIDSGCSQGDVTIVAPNYMNATYTWYLNNVITQVGTDRFYAPATLGLPVEVSIQIEGCPSPTVIGPITPTDLNADGLVPTVSSVTVSSDGTGYFKLEVIPTSSVAGMEYRLVNSLGYETAWQVSNIFRGVIGGDTKIMIRVRGNSCITTYNLNLS